MRKFFKKRDLRVNCKEYRPTHLFYFIKLSDLCKRTDTCEHPHTMVCNLRGHVNEWMVKDCK